MPQNVRFHGTGKYRPMITNERVTLTETMATITWTESPRINFMGTSPQHKCVSMPREVWDAVKNK